MATIGCIGYIAMNQLKGQAMPTKSTPLIAQGASWSYKAKGVRAHEAGRKACFFPIESNLFRVGKNVLAIDGHNASLGSSDFTIDLNLVQKK